MAKTPGKRKNGQPLTDFEVQFVTMFATVRSTALRRFLALYAMVTAGQLEWISRYGKFYRRKNVKRRMMNNAPRCYPGVKAIMAETGCSYRTARDYQRAFDIILQAQSVSEARFLDFIRASRAESNKKLATTGGEG